MPVTTRKRVFSTPNDGWSTGRILQLVPEQDIQLLLQMADNMSRAKWTSGDMANNWIAHGLPAMWTYKAIADLTGKQTTAIRTYAYAARRIKGDVREEYGNLSFEHFKIALQCDNPTEVLDYASKTAEERYGRPASVDELRAVFKGLRKFEIDDEQVIYGARPSLPTFSIPFQRKIFLIQDPDDKARAERMLQELCDFLETLDKH